MNRFLINLWNVVNDSRFWKAVSIVTGGYALLAPDVLSTSAGLILAKTAMVAIGLSALCGSAPGKVEPPDADR